LQSKKYFDPSHSESKKYFDPSHSQSKKYFDPSHSQSKKYFDPSHLQLLVDILGVDILRLTRRKLDPQIDPDVFYSERPRGS